MSRVRPAGSRYRGRPSRDDRLLWRFCGLSGALHALAAGVLLLLAQPPAPTRLGKAVDVEILRGRSPGSRPAPESKAPTRSPAPRVARRPPPPPRPKPVLPPRPPVPPAPRPAAKPDPATVWVGKKKLKPSPLPELQPEEARREAQALVDTLQPADAVPPATAPLAEDAGRGAGSAGEGEGADVVAVYEGGTVTRQQLQEYVRDQLGGYSLADLQGAQAAKLDIAAGMLTRLVLDEVMLKEAEARGLDQHEGVRQALRRLSEDENIAELAERIGARIVVSNSEIAAYYEKHRDQLKDVPLAHLQERIRQALTREKAHAAFDAYLDRQKAQATIERRFSLLDDPRADPNATLFTVNGKAYTVAQWRDDLLRMTPEERNRCADPEYRAQVLESLITRYLLLDAASTITDEGLRKRLEQIRRMLLINTLYHEEVDRQVQVTDAEVAQYYEQVKEQWSTIARARISVAAIPLGKGEAERGKAAEAAGRLRQAIADGATFTAAAEPLKAEFPRIQVVEKTRWMGELDHLDDLFQPCAFHTRVFRTLAVGELSEPFRYGSHIYVVKVLEREEPRTPKQEEIGPYLRDEIWSSKQEDAERRYLKGVLDRARIRIRTDALAEMVRPPVVAAPAAGGTGDEGRGTGDASARTAAP